MSTKDPKETAAALAVAAGRNLARAVTAHGPSSPEVQEAASLASTALDHAEAAGCTPADYAAYKTARSTA